MTTNTVLAENGRCHQLSGSAVRSGGVVEEDWPSFGRSPGATRVLVRHDGVHGHQSFADEVVLNQTEAVIGRGDWSPHAFKLLR